jgi:hypothetical protein
MVQALCPLCGEPHANLSLNLWCIDEDAAVTCRECDGEFSLAQVRDVVARWTKLLAWIDAIPAMEE